MRWVRGNADREVVAHFDRGDTDHSIYGADAPAQRADAFTAGAHRRARTATCMAGFEDVVRLDGALYCHGSPRSDEEIITALTPGERLAPMLAGVARRWWCAATPITSSSCARATGASSTPAAWGCPTRAERGAFWLLVADGEPELRRTDYDIEAAGAALRASGFPDVDDLIRESLVEPVDAGLRRAPLRGRAPAQA